MRLFRLWRRLRTTWCQCRCRRCGPTSRHSLRTAPDDGIRRRERRTWTTCGGSSCRRSVTGAWMPSPRATCAAGSTICRTRRAVREPLDGGAVVADETRRGSEPAPGMIEPVPWNAAAQVWLPGALPDRRGVRCAWLGARSGLGRTCGRGVALSALHRSAQVGGGGQRWEHAHGDRVVLPDAKRGTENDRAGDAGARHPGRAAASRGLPWELASDDGMRSRLSLRGRRSAGGRVSASFAFTISATPSSGRGGYRRGSADRCRPSRPRRY